MIFWQRRLTVGWWLLLAPAAAAAWYVLLDLRRLKASIFGVDLAVSIETGKQIARKVPGCLTLLAWSMAGAALAVFMNRPGRNIFEFLAATRKGCDESY